MKIVCPTCNTVYDTPTNEIPHGRMSSTTCMNCGGQIVIETKAERIESESFRFDTDSSQELKEEEGKIEAVFQPTRGLKKTSVILVILLSIITLGFYYPVWFLRRRNAINNLHSEEKLGSGVFIFAIVAYSISLLIEFIHLEGITGKTGVAMGLDLFASILDLFAGILLWIQCFKVRRILQEHFRETLSGVATFFLTIYYLQYKINRL